MSLLKSHKNQTVIEEVFNAASHGIGAILSGIALLLLCRLAYQHAGDKRMIASIAFGGSLLLTYTASMLYHSFSFTKLKHLLKIIDHAAIYLLIAGSYTPFMLVAVDTDWSHQFLYLIWGMALFGVIYKIFFIYGSPKVSLGVYLLMGWMALFASKALYQHLPTAGLLWLIAGGLSYTAGAVFYAWKRLYFSHTLWHIFVLLGSSCHFICVYYYII